MKEIKLLPFSVGVALIGGGLAMMYLLTKEVCLELKSPYFNFLIKIFDRRKKKI